MTILAVEVQNTVMCSDSLSHAAAIIKFATRGTCVLTFLEG